MDWKVYAFEKLRGAREITRFVDGFLAKHGRNNGSRWVDYALDKWVTPGTEAHWRSALERHTVLGRVGSGLRQLGAALERGAKRVFHPTGNNAHGSPSRAPALLPQLGAALAR